MGLLAALVAVIAAVQLAGTWQATTANLWQRLGPSSYALGAVAACLAISAAARAATERRYAEVLLVGGLVLAITGGFAHVDWLTHSQLPTLWSGAAARSMLIVQLATGFGAVVAAVMLLEARAAATAPTGDPNRVVAASR